MADDQARRPDTNSRTEQASPPSQAPTLATTRSDAADRTEAARKATTTVADAGAPDLGFNPLAMLDPEQRSALERLSVNLARAALTAQGAVAEAALRQADRPAALNPDPFHVGPAMGEVMGQIASHPDRVLRAQGELFERYLDLWRTTTQKIAGAEAEATVQPAKGDKRFNDPEWSKNLAFDVMKQSYLLTSNWMNSLVTDVEGVDPMTKRRVEFFTKMLTDAFSPSNFLVSNPAALKALVQSEGESLVKGAENFAEDLQRGGGQLAISQTDFSRFEVGKNVATAPGNVVFQNALFQLLQFTPTTETVFETPLLIFPPWINKFYIMDLKPENSMIRWLTDQGITVFVVSWVNPGPELAGKTFEDYMFEGAYTAVETVLKQADVERVNTVGYCIGGTMLSCTLAHMAAAGYDKVNSATFFAAQQDFSEAGDLLLFTNEEWLKDLEGLMDAAGGVLPGAQMADTFNMLRANDLIWSFFVNNYLLGKEPAAFDLLFWNSDQTRMPKALHMQYLRDFYKDNKLAKGELTLGGVKLDLGKVQTPIFVQSSKDDHIAPMRSVYNGAKRFGGPVTFMLAGSGHIAGVINPPGAKKYQHWINTCEHLPPTVEEWREGAKEFPGSWWPAWREWLGQRSGEQVPARDPAKGPLPPKEDAPGSYVKVRSDAAAA